MYKVVFGGYEYPDEYDSYDEAYEAGLEMASAYNQGGIDLYLSNPGDYVGGLTSDGEFEVIECF